MRLFPADMRECQPGYIYVIALRQSHTKSGHNFSFRSDFHPVTGKAVSQEGPKPKRVKRLYACICNFFFPPPVSIPGCSPVWDVKNMSIPGRLLLPGFDSPSIAHVRFGNVARAPLPPPPPPLACSHIFQNVTHSPWPIIAKREKKKKNLEGSRHFLVTNPKVPRVPKSGFRMTLR